VSYVAYASVTDDDRQTTPSSVTSLAPYTRCRRASNKEGMVGIQLVAYPTLIPEWLAVV